MSAVRWDLRGIMWQSRLSLMSNFPEVQTWEKQNSLFLRLRGRAEPARLMLEDNAVEYENRFVSL